MKSQQVDLPAPIQGEPLLSVRHLTVDFVDADGRPLRAIEDVSFDVFPGQTLGLVGESGCGKTTTMLAILRLLPSAGRIVAGEVFLEGANLMRLSDRDIRQYRWKEIAMVFQSAMNALNPVIRVGDQIQEAILQHRLMEHAAAE